ncbi:WG repeat-containing protein [Hymenobacter sp. BT175]|uniref:WG repeat-containing protein n=1 Tax=Hymenobacter translucens TaxID=2886507 RepID=UPI001D0EC6B0|nr:WG repeat-containing protein [Hymenobacter translucens]MCC2546693.1 WG repeat-containing protein [Hymenobacter translucens]
MLHDFLYTPFADPATARLYDRLVATLREDSGAGPTLLLGHFAVEAGGEPLDAVVIRPHSITVLVLVPHGGPLQMPALDDGNWLLDGHTLSGSSAEADNPYAQFQRQKAALATWLQPQFGPDQANLHFISGLVVFGAPVTFAPEVEARLSQLPDGSFQLLANADQLPRRLARLARPEIDIPQADLTEWAHSLAADDMQPVPAAPSPAFPSEPEPVPAPGFLRRAWSWLGADDIPADTPYGHPAAQAAASTAEMQRLEQLQRDAQVKLQQQLQALEAREAERERRMEELRAELAQAPPVASEAQVLRDRLAAESQEKAALEAAIQASRAESDRHNRDLDAKIRQLGQLVEQLNNRAAGPTTATGNQRRRGRLPRAAAVVGAAALLGAGAWGVGHLGRTSSTPTPVGEAHEPTESNRTAESSPNPAAGVRQPSPPAAGASPAGQPQTEPAAVDPYEVRFPPAGGFTRVKKNGAYTFLDQDGQPFSRTFLEARDFSEGHAAVRDQRGWQYISGPEPEDPDTPPFLFHEAYSFREGLARVRLDPGYTYITKRNLAGQGPSVFQLYEAATDFEDGRAQVTLQRRRFTIDTNGQPVD